MRKNKPATGGTRHVDDDSQEEKPPYLPPLIDPSEIFNCPAPVNEPLADARLFGGDIFAALRHKWRDYTDEEGRVHVTNASTVQRMRRGEDGKPVLVRELERPSSLHIGEPRPTTAVEGSVERLKAAGIVGLYRERVRA